MTDHSTLIDAIPTDLWIGGKQVPSSAGTRFPVHNPATGAVLTTVADAAAADGAIALDEATAVQRSWAATAARERAEILRRAWELVIARRDDFALAMTLEMGKPLAESQGEVAYGGEFLRWFSEEAVRINGRYTSSPTGAGRILVAKQPIGPTLAITPWNFPLAMGTRKIGPALAAGCTMIVKPAAETPLTMLLLGQVFADAGLPAGVLSILPTTNASALTGPLIDDPRLRKLTFTGSTGVGKILLSQCATRVLRSSMELGGNAPFVVFDDADVDAAVDGAMAAKMRNIGEACTAANRFHVDNAVRAEFTEKLTARMGALTIGPGDENGVQVGPLITAKQRASVDELVQDAVSKGAVVTTGGAVADGEGYFYPPTVLTDVPADARILREEVFGPVAAITGFDGEEAGIAAANDTEFGLAAYVYTANLDRALRVSQAVESGMVGVNRGVISDVAAPFGGIKESGIGREAGSEGIEEYLETKYIALP
ncbi:NAD-dependent succinate-semialdehyde dehydrogenase [Mycobacteroides abscessus]|uniref:NAD-dependent succinate-semialdehyde dehydrogenase n=1 Tax=Mycobacteroides abscessus TaxID=36809 RepID=UPI00092A7283|nr:NAD-dependent succinate-semialdehyde dehydrogenase [Mycobacteroides abscessus]MBN7454502.1 NAD-dependent succinate-semialdehyde dehydrogenase [Mycobacteroides abscessus subsp. abscessus]MBN7545082.1 NAD-dependent succinate-semialdehyde dehydrogenase [Mycobacteroides abscessus subsp. abscessus]MBN7567880.1 NAD-dependent succinate-semialdehyde dehydrogenase [Mycobacteroides abscessus subsp. abscessus]QSM93742.1 NAD-dependent succinate-semialdehyde dehydrogenase [Mycobacteroides abscessus subsp